MTREQRLGLDVTPFLDADAELDVPDQTGTGDAVRLEEVRVSRREGFVAVFTTTGTLLGSAAVTPSVQPVTVGLSGVPTDTAQLVAVLFADDGDGRLEVGVDAPVVDDDGEFERSEFDYRLR